MRSSIITPDLFEVINIKKGENLNAPLYCNIRGDCRFNTKTELFRPVVFLDVFEDDHALKIIAEIPGVDKKDIDLKIDKDVLTIEGRKANDQEMEGTVYHLLECSYGYFNRSIVLPLEPAPQDVEVDLKDGVLTLSIRKRGE